MPMPMGGPRGGRGPQGTAVVRPSGWMRKASKERCMMA